MHEGAPPPVDLCCPITRQLMADPVMLVDSSQTYERAAIQEWLDRGNLKDPVTGEASCRGLQEAWPPPVERLDCAGTCQATCTLTRMVGVSMPAPYCASSSHMLHALLQLHAVGCCLSKCFLSSTALTESLWACVPWA